MKHYLCYIFLVLLFISCDNDSHDNHTHGHKLFVTLQDSDGVAIIDSDNLNFLEIININLSDIDCSTLENQMDCEMAGCMWHTMGDTAHCMNMNMNMTETPHDVVVDDANGYWFTSTIMAGYIGMYSLESNQLISSYLVGDQPALLALDSLNKKLYVSRMMSMSMDDGMDMGSTTNIIHELSYASDILESSNEFNLQFSAPHAIGFDNIYGNIYTASNTSDYMAKIEPLSGAIDYVSLDSSYSQNPTIELNRLKPLKIAIRYPYVFISCSGGEWYDSNTGNTEMIPGQVQMRHIDDMSLLKIFEFSTFSHPWHIHLSLIEDKIFVALSGDQASDTDSGVACLEYGQYANEYFLNNVWQKSSDSYGTMHGIAVSSNGEYVYASGRTDGNIYKFDASTGDEIGFTNLVSSGGVRTGGIALSHQAIHEE